MPICKNGDLKPLPNRIKPQSYFIRIVLFLLAGALACGAQTVNFTSSNLPVIIIDTNGQYIPDDNKIVADMGIIDNGPGQRNNVTDAHNNYSGRIAIELRGSSSQMFPKKQYALETQDNLGNNLNVPLLGMPPENDWILYAPYSDKSLMRNVLAYQLAWDLGHYASRTRFCELVLNGDYVGVYVLMEKIKRDKNRVDLATLNPQDIIGDQLTGGYIIKIDKRAGESVLGWYSPFLPYEGSTSRIYYQYHYPKPDDIVNEQKAYIQGVMNKFESVMFNPEYNDPATGYRNYIDVESFIDFFILNEVSKNVDGYRLSTYFYKDRDSTDSRIHLGPIWDFNLAFGNADYYEGGSTYGWQVELNTQPQFVQTNDSFKIPFWWQKLMDDPWFVSRLKCRWQQLRENLLATDRLQAFVDSIAAVLDESQERNFTRWPILDEYVWPNRVWLGNYPDEVGYLKTWLKTRLSWIDTYIPGDCTLEISEPEALNLPDDFHVRQNYPNPFNAGTRIEFGLPVSGNVQIAVYDINGRVVWQEKRRVYSAGSHVIDFLGTDHSGRALPSGFYFCRIGLDERVKIIKMLMIK